MKKKQNIFFIVGTGRCGTQMLSAMLNKYPDIYITPESHFIPVAIEELGIHNVLLDDFLSLIQRDADWRNKRPWIESMIKHSSYCSSIEELSATLYNKFGQKADLRDIIDELFAILSGSKTIVGDKTPFYGCFMSSLLQLWPEAKFIYLTRHPEDCAKSMQKHPGFRRMCSVTTSGKEITKYRYSSIKMANISDHFLTLEQAKRFWLNVNYEIEKEQEKIPHFCILKVRYEDLVAYPAQQLSKIEEFLEIKESRFLVKLRAIAVPDWNLNMRGTNLITNEELEFLNMSKRLSYPTVVSYTERISHFLSELSRLPAIAYSKYETTLKRMKSKIGKLYRLL
jgi:hypothetical protein